MAKICKRGHASSVLANGRNARSECKECKKTRNTMFRARTPGVATKWKHKNPANSMLHKARERAKKVGVDCTITVADIVIPERCPWLGIRLAAGHGKPHDGSPSLDRIIPEIGYVRGNVIVISHKANSIKSSGTPGQVAAVARGLRAAYPQWLLVD